ncbi:restriction endonuclease subunit S [Streptomyces sp. NBC_00391]|uniref:restriction endonuclease subunit S n=1 Tax=Streptomyces sp. NBC_00391 TaxID=2903647 RepID=UPI002E1EFDE3
MSEWERGRLNEVIALDVDAVPVTATAPYDIVGVLNRGRGLLFRDPIAGDETSYKTLNRIRPNQIIYSRLKAFEGAITVAPNDLGEVYASQEFPTFTCGERMLPEYFRLLTTTKRLWEQLQALSTGMGGRRERVKPADFLTIEIPCPSTSEQARIVDLMAAVDAQIEALEAEADAGHNFCSIQRSQLVTTPDGRAETPLGEVMEVHHGWAFPASGCRSPLGDGTPRLIRIGDFARNRRSHFDPGRSDEFTGDYPERFLLSAGDLLVVMTCQTPDGAILGWPMRVPPAGGPYLHNQRIGRVEVTASDRIDLRYAYHLFRSDHLNRALCVTAAGTKVLHTSPTKILEVPVFFPPLDEQKRVADALDALDENVQQCETELAHLRSFRSALLFSLLNREIEIPESYDALLKAVS